MKTLSIILFLTFVSCSVMAQVETLYDGQIESGGYGGPILKTGSINGETGIFFGGQGGWIINHRMVVGGKFYMLANPTDVEGLNNIVVGFLGGGALFEYMIASNKLIHFSIENMVGAGGVYNDVGNYTAGHDPLEYTGDACFIMEPGINVNLNVTKMFRIGAGVTYRYVNGIDYDPGSRYVLRDDHGIITDTSLRGVSAQIIFKIGTF